MPIILVGLNHRTAPVALRESVSLSSNGLDAALQALHPPPCPSGLAQPVVTAASAGLVHEHVILSTCNRLEIYAVTTEASSGVNAVQHCLARLSNLWLEHLGPYLYVLAEQTAVQHLMRVAAGLDSMILGEPQILGQVSRASSGARTARTLGPILSRLFMQAVHAGKRARSDTPISRHTTSVGHAAVLLAREKVGGLRHTRVVVVGAGAMGALVAQALHTHGVQSITCLNRTTATAEALARRVQGQALPWSDLPAALAWADVVITATGAPHCIITGQEVARVLAQRQERPLVFVDTAMPRDVEEAVGDLPGVYRYDLDDVQTVMDASLAQRQAAVPEVEAIIEAEAARFMEWRHNRQITPVIATLRHKALAVANSEVAEALRHMDGLVERDQQMIARLAHRIVHKLLHAPTMCLKAHATQGNTHGYTQMVQELFALEHNYDATCA
jgi:glutamyl-tRNA reductase